MEQILTEYRLKAKKIHPDKNLNDPTAKCNFARLQEAKEVLTDPHVGLHVIVYLFYATYTNCILSDFYVFVPLFCLIKR